MFKRINYLLILSLIVISCSEKELSHDSCFDEKHTVSHFLKFSPNMRVIFKLDSVSPSNLSYSKIVDVNDTLYYSFLNMFNNIVYMYNYDSKELVRKILLKGNRKITGYEFIDWDSIFVYQYSNYELTLQNGKGEIIKKSIIPPQPGKNGYYSMPTTLSPVTFLNNIIYLVGGHLTTEKANHLSKPVARFNLVTDELDYVYHYPEVYQNTFYGGSNYRMDISYVYNFDDSVFVFNFPASEELFITQRFYCAPSFLAGKIFKYPYKGMDKSFEYAANNPFYLSILYDKYRKVYYRVCLLPADWSEGKHYSRDLSVIILDKNFRFLGETVLKNGKDFQLSYIQNTHVTPDGLLFQGKSDVNETEINFNIFTLKDIDG